MIFKDYYKILGLKTNKVSEEDIKVAYREHAKKYHPDVNVGNKNAEERFKDINEAYRVLSDVNAKKKYDKMWNNYARKQKSKVEGNTSERVSALGDFVKIFFGSIDNKKQQFNSSTMSDENIAKKGENIETEITITLYEAFFGCDKKISLKTVNRSNKGD